MLKSKFSIFTDSVLNFLVYTLIKTIILWGCYALLVPSPFTFLPTVSFFEMIIVVLFFESFFTTSTQAKMLYYIENINFVANMLYYKEKAIQNMVNALMKNKENVSITEIKSKNEKDDIDKPED